MSARFTASSKQLASVGEFLSHLTTATAETGITIHGRFTIETENESTIDVAWDDELAEYLVDDLVGGPS